MEINLNDITVKIVNLDSRPDRWEKVVGQMNKIGITNYNRFSAITDGGAWCGSVTSHFRCIIDGSGPLIVFEDDVDFTDNIHEILPKAISQLPEDFDMFYFGANVKHPAERYSDNLFRVKSGVHTNHAIMFSDNARNIIRNHYNEFVKDGVFDFASYCPKHVTFDHWLFTTGQNIMKCYVCSPMVAFQKGGMSDVRNDNMDAIYMEEMSNNEKINMA